MKTKKLTATLCAAVTLTMSFMPLGVQPVTAADTQMREISTMELVRDMGVGINLGNTMESAGDWIAQWTDGSVQAYETAWGSPVITKEMIHGMAEEGFGVVRIPVAWSNKMEMSDYTISKEYMERVQELVDWTIDEGMYAIVNIHWDNGWLENFPTDKEGCMNRYTRMWEQICDGFEAYGDHLIFESQNEELGWSSMWNQWGGPSDKEGSFALCNEVNQKFVDVVRASGGNNPKRHLLISGYNTAFDHTCDPLFHMPSDPAGRCAVSVHYYTPVSFAILEEDADWAKCRSTWGTKEDFDELEYYMNMMKTNYVDKGIPVIIGEYGCPTTNKDADSVRLFLKSVCESAYEKQMCPVLWSTPGGHYDRTTCKMADAEMSTFYQQYKTASPQPPTETATEPGLISGDMNKDGSVTVLDIIILQKYLLGLQKINAETFAIADMNADGSINVFDLGLLKNLLLK